MANFQSKIPILGKFLEGLAMEDVGIFYGQLVYFTPFGRFCGHLVYFKAIWNSFSRFGILK
jgi:hypothetical protein